MQTIDKLHDCCHSQLELLGAVIFLYSQSMINSRFEMFVEDQILVMGSSCL